MSVKEGDIVRLMVDPDDEDSGLQAGDTGRVVYVDESDGQIIVDWFGSKAGEMYEPSLNEIRVIKGVKL